MNFFKKFFFIFVFYTFNISSLLSAENVVFLDIDYVLNNSDAGKIIYEELEKINQNNIDLFNKKENDILKKKEEINKTKNIAAKEKLEQEIKKYNQEVEKYKKEKNNILNEFKKSKDAKLKKFLKDINPFIVEYMKQNSVDIVLEKNQIFIGNQNKDITDDIIDIINKNLKNNG